LDDLLDALEHYVEIQCANLPPNKIKERNWKGKLILAEIRSWAAEQNSKEEALMAFREMLDTLLKSNKIKEKRQVKYAK
jgi:hypothetical protein